MLIITKKRVYKYIINSSTQIQQNSLELAAAIKELEASTAALECSYSDSTQASQSSLNSSSGYGTMNSTPAVSEDTIASGGKLTVVCIWVHIEKITSSFHTFESDTQILSI